jgi:hypothetical protein
VNQIPESSAYRARDFMQCHHAGSKHAASFGEETDQAGSSFDPAGGGF